MTRMGWQTEGCRRGAFLAAALVLPLPALAQSFPEGCWVRDYTPEHLAAHPAQVVGHLDLHFTETNVGPTLILRATPVGGGPTLRQEAICSRGDDIWNCAVECDGGVLTAQRRNDVTLDIVTPFFLVGEEGAGCDSGLDLAEAPGEDTTYRLFRQEVAACQN